MRLRGAPRDRALRRGASPCPGPPVGPLVAGDRDQQLRRELVVRAGERLAERGVPVEVVVYPGVQRAFDFRWNGRTVGDDLAREDALARTVRLLNRVLDARARETD